MKSRLLALVIAVFAAGCVTTEIAPPPRPKLVLFLVVGGLPQWQVVDYRDQLAPDGFMPAPEYSKSLGRDAGRLNVPQVLARLNEGLAAKFGAGPASGRLQA